MTQRSSLSNQVVVVTGACCGAGRAIAQAFARSGAHVSLCGACEGRLRATALELRARGGITRTGPADHFLVDPERVDVWVNVPHERSAIQDTIVDETRAPLRSPGGAIINVWTGAPSRYLERGQLGSDLRVMTRRVRSHGGLGDVSVTNVEANGAPDDALANVVTAIAEVRARRLTGRRDAVTLRADP